MKDLSRDGVASKLLRLPRFWHRIIDRLTINGLVINALVINGLVINALVINALVIYGLDIKKGNVLSYNPEAKYFLRRRFCIPIIAAISAFVYFAFLTYIR